jgi:hypothetical protein
MLKNLNQAFAEFIEESKRSVQHNLLKHKKPLLIKTGVL